MTLLRREDSKKWIQGFLVISGVLAGYLTSVFFRQIGDWFELESKIHFYNGLSQFLGVSLGLFIIFFMIKNNSVSSYLDEVYQELVKVIWPNHEDTVRLTIGILIGVTITAVLLGLVDFSVGKVFSFLYNN